MNIHHLELFYYVARHGGITQAVRKIPYGIQQPAVSGQIAQLETFLGTPLFQRRPFVLSPSGEKLYRYIEPFFSGLDDLSKDLRSGKDPQIRIGSADMVLRDYLPALLKAARKKFPRLKVALREGYQPDLEGMLDRQEIDVAVTLIENKPPAGISSRALLKLPLVLLVPKESPLRDAAELWRLDRIQEPLICLPASETICKHFQRGLGRLGVDWFPGIEISSLDLIAGYVANGFGLGLTIAVPKALFPADVRALPLPGFDPVVLGVMWRGKPSPVLEVILEEMQAKVRQLQT